MKLKLPLTIKVPAWVRLPARLKADRVAMIAGISVLTIGLVWLLFVAMPRWYGKPQTSQAQPPAAPVDNGRKIKARLFYVADGGTRLKSVVSGWQSVVSVCSETRSPGRR